MPQLDALRAFAVGAVLVHHGLDERFLPAVLSSMPGGDLGVKLFFVLSGFLITGILLQWRKISVEPDRLVAARQFYIRRFLRIFPLYYFVVLSAFLLNVTPVRTEIWWLLTYTFNFRVAMLGWWPENVSHFWSLAVEEQFYLFWPWVILFVPGRGLMPAALTMVLLGPLYRLFALIWENGIAFYTVTFSSFDALGIGALLAIACRGAPAPPHVRLTWSVVVLPCAAVALLILWTGKIWSFVPGNLVDVFIDSTIALIFGWMVCGASAGFTGPLGNLLEWEPLRYCGRVAYGIYVYHLLLAEPVYSLGVRLGFGWARGGYLSFAVATLVTVAVASLSWHFLEQPINALKSRFSYTATGSQQTSTVSS
jgi:peptidoglycan/LPS O-acetylase OafA/YrhL